MSPSTKVFEIAQGSDSRGNPKAVSLKVFDTQADFDGPTEIQTKHFTLIAKGGIIQSRVVHEHYEGGAKMGRSILQPLILAPVGGNVLKSGMSLIPR